MEMNTLLYVHKLSDEIIRLRRYLHQHPELSFEEYETSKFVYQQLSNIEGCK